MRPKLARVFAAMLLWNVSMLAQTTDTSTSQSTRGAKPQFFAGTVTALDNKQITVSRTPVGGHSPEHRTFLINPKTRMNKSALKIRSRVTVKYQHVADGDVALEIQPQPLVHSSKPS
jgi:hypothetical protein